MSAAPADRPATRPEALAAAIREGLEGRLSFSPLATAPRPYVPPPERHRLTAMLATSGLRGTPAPAGGSRVGWVPRQLRRAAKWLINPWLEQQTQFNHLAFEQVHVLTDFTTRLAEAMNALAAIDRAEGDGHRGVHQRLNDCMLDLYHLRQELAAVEPKDDDETARLWVDPAHVIEGLFLHTRVPLPPARTLVLSAGAAHALDLASLGFQVVSLAGRPAGGHPNLSAASATDGPWPFESGQFDLVVGLSGEGPAGTGLGVWRPEAAEARGELARLLAPGGRVIGSVRAGAGGPPDPAAVLAPFRPVEVAYAARSGQGWRLDDRPGRDCELALFVGLNG